MMKSPAIRIGPATAYPPASSRTALGESLSSCPPTVRVREKDWVHANLALDVPSHLSATRRTIRICELLVAIALSTPLLVPQKRCIKESLRRKDCKFLHLTTSSRPYYLLSCLPWLEFLTVGPPEQATHWPLVFLVKLDTVKGIS
ncbi:hypothetical protein VTO42DRAFT_6681 [Malbranchea cinnamomea]